MLREWYKHDPKVFGQYHMHLVRSESLGGGAPLSDVDVVEKIFAKDTGKIFFNETERAAFAQARGAFRTLLTYIYTRKGKMKDYPGET